MNLISNGNTAQIYEYDREFVCKLFHQGYPKIYVEHEFDNAQAVFQLGIKTPAAYKMVYIDDRCGIIYDRIIGEELSTKIYKGDERIPTEWFDTFIKFHKELLGHSIDYVTDYKDFLKLFAEDSLETIAKINVLEDGNCLLHGDFHPGNVMVDSLGHLVLIDMMNVCKGPAIYDIARTYFLIENDRNLQNLYLKMMECNFEAIRPYLEVISLLREKEATR